jgi:glycosyltransferase involved in cell wall biosynthesis
MRVALDTSAALVRPSGIGRYVTELTAALSRIEGVELRTGLPFNLWRGVQGAAVLAGAREFLYENVRLPAIVRAAGIDVYHATAARLPARRLSIPIVATVHDFAAFEFPSWQGTLRGWKLRGQIRRAVAGAHAIIVPSDAIRRELVARAPSAAARTLAIPHGVAAVFREVRRAAPTSPTFVSVATLERRKNLVVLLEAFARVLAGHPAARLRLIGQEQNAGRALRDRVRGLGIADAVTVEGYVSDGHLAAAYAAATATVYPSVYEGFGLPILESMAAGAPVITSAAGAMGEVAGAAALRVDALDAGSLAAAMSRIIDDPALGPRLAAAGRARAAGFTWESCARRHLETYRTAVEDLGRPAPG